MPFSVCGTIPLLGMSVETCIMFGLLVAFCGEAFCGATGLAAIDIAAIITGAINFLIFLKNSYDFNFRFD
ncbi:MAG: hypothetical protein NVSMB56_06670 [Pyrinomonadaceae bacterium]